MGWNLWHCQAASAFDIMDRAQEFDVDGLILEFGYSEDLPAHGWDYALEDLALYEGMLGFEKTGEKRDYVLRTRASVQRIIDEAAARNMKVYVMTPEIFFWPEILNKYPDLTDPSKDMMYDIPAKRLAEVFDILPGLGGIKLYLDEGAVNINDIDSPVPPEDRIYRLLSSLLDVCKEKNRTLILTTFTLMPHQADAIANAVRRIEPCENFIIDQYPCPGDWGRIRIHNQLIGNIGGHREQISFDYCGEVWGQSVIPLCQASFIRDTLDEVQKKSANIIGISGYITWGDNALGTPSESSIYTASRMIKGDTRDPQEIVLEWAQRKYGVQAAPFVVNALENTWETVLKSWNDLGFWVQEFPKSELADIGWYNWSLHWESLAIWDESYRDIERMLYYPTEAAVRAVTAEKDEAVYLAQMALEEIKKTEPFLSEADYAELHRYFARELVLCRIFRSYSEGFYRARMFYAGDKSQESKVREQIVRMRELADDVEKMNDSDFWICRHDRVLYCVRQLGEILEGAEWPKVSKEFDVEVWNEQLRKWGYPVI